MPSTPSNSPSPPASVGFMIANGSCMASLFEGIMAASVNILTSIVGILLNSVVCATIVKTRSLRTNFSVLMCNLAVADLLLSLVVKPILVALIIPTNQDACFSSSEILLRMVEVFAFAFNACSMATLFWLSVDRCLCVVFPIKYSRLVTRARIKTLIGLSWFGTISCIIIAFAFPVVRSEGTRIAILTGIIFSYIVIFVCYAMIYVKIRKQNALRAEMQAATMSTASQAREKKFALTMALVVVVFTCSWAPLGYILMRARKQSFSYSSLIWVVTTGLTNSTINPALYYFRCREYRNASRKLLARYCPVFASRRVECTEPPTQHKKI